MNSNQLPKPMDAGGQFCPNLHCALRGLKGQANITVHCSQRRRYRCKACGKTFSERSGTVFAGLRTEQTIVLQVLTLLAYGCPLQAIVQAFGLDERTVASWRDRAGVHCEKLQQTLLQGAELDLQHVQADEIRVKARGKVVWLAMALMVSTRLWLGGVTSQQRDRKLAQKLLQLVAAWAKPRAPLLVQTDGWPAYPGAILKAFRVKLPRPASQRGRCRLEIWPDLAIVQVVKQKVAGRLIGLKRLLKHGKLDEASALLKASGGGQVFNTSYIERFNATLRERLAVLTRRTRHGACQTSALHCGMYLIGTCYNLCWFHHSLRLLNPSGEGQKWQERTPAMASGLTDHRWSMAEVLSYKIAPPPYLAPKRRGRPPKLKSSVVNVPTHHLLG